MGISCGLYCQDASAELANNTFYLNTAADSGAGLYCINDGGTRVTSAILWGNTPDQVASLGCRFPHGCFRCAFSADRWTM